MAKVLTGISGNLISAASAGFAPTNSADVSAIASAYQVVSATATQLYAGTAYVTSVNDSPLSASRAGNAANASMATSAYYDGTGRLISALPDSAAVSAIASAYAESAASSKLYESATADFYPTSNPSGFISSVDLSDYATTAYVDSSVSGKLDSTASSQFLTAVPAGYATTDYVDNSISGFAYNSAVSGWTAKQDALTFGYDTSDKISSINGSSLAGEGGGLVTAIGTSESGITSINNSGLIDTAALRSADYSSLYVQEPLYISASGDSSYIGISGNVGGVDSATCSAIASSYAESAVSSYQPLSGMSGYASAFSAGEGLEFVQSGSDQVLQVEAPVDIVAGPGIVIDNPDGNTLRVSVAADYETVLWEGEGIGSNFPITLSESITNFERIRVYVKWHPTLAAAYQCFEYLVSSNSDVWQGMCAAITGNDFYQSFFTLTVSNGSSVAYTYGRLRGNYTVGQTNEKQATFCKVVGIHRIANN